MQVRVEFFGVPRLRAGVAGLTVDAAAGGWRLRDLSAELAVRFPAFSADCLEAGCLRPAYTANVNGDRFVRDGDTALADGDQVFIMSSDAGG